MTHYVQAYLFQRNGCFLLQQTEPPSKNTMQMQEALCARAFVVQMTLLPIPT